jgi:hypothetical protein
MKNFSSLTLRIQLLEYYQKECVDKLCNLLNICYNNNITKVGIEYYNILHFKDAYQYVNKNYSTRIFNPGFMSGIIFANADENTLLNIVQQCFTLHGGIINNGYILTNTVHLIPGIYEFDKHWSLIEY